MFSRVTITLGIGRHSSLADNSIYLDREATHVAELKDKSGSRISVAVAVIFIFKISVSFLTNMFVQCFTSVSFKLICVF